MKKIVWYLVVSVVFAIIFRATDVLSQKALFGKDSEMLSGLGIDTSSLGGLGGLTGLSGLGSLGIGGMGGLGDLIGGNSGGSGIGGTCSGDTPLMLTDGQCVTCDFVLKYKSDILMGCEKCPELKKKGITCAFAMDVDENATQKDNKKSKKSKKDEKPAEPTHKYTLVNIMGIEDKIQLTLVNNETGQKNIVSVGDTFDGYTVKSISLEEGIVVEKNGVVEDLDIGI